MERFSTYRTFYLIGIPVFLISLIWPFMQVPYLLMFIVLSFGFVFSDELIPEDPQRSTVTHFERNSRYNLFNYIIAGGLVFAAIVIGAISAPPHITTFIVWTASLAGLYYFIKYYGNQILKVLIVDYILTQMPELDFTELEGCVTELLKDITTPTTALTTKYKITTEQAEKVKSYTRTYLENNITDTPEIDQPEESE